MTNIIHKSIRRFYSTAPQASVLQYCVDSCRKYDHDHYLSTLLWTDEKAKKAHFALRAFNIELARISDVTSQEISGSVRIQFWRDTIAAVYGQKDIPQNPVALALADTCREYKLTKRWFERLLNARESDLQGNQPVTLDDLQQFVENTSSSLYYLTVELFNVKDVHVDHAASHLGKAVGIVSLLRGTPMHATKRRAYIPSALLAQHGVSTESMFRGESSAQLREAVFEVASLANNHLTMSREINKDIPNHVKPIFLPAESCSIYLEELRKRDFEIFDPTLRQNSYLPLQMKMLWNKWNKRY
eukprot:TRINITY_DN5816_c0_g1::TRINITY_DN5816_c0_g1_i1::g.24350::m.24350 TRINITY_DN5816_c0_g1::TRINITY_DN5816_c0_g1_i1::g.24350  ORF type:complete len:301 (+),score=25.69,sp/A7YVD7/NDUF6_BOVIN/40.86/6e-71,SQS_PSY/PF00494.14/6.4e-53 TRINITY_DN5816_c0_g1_i1:92-994(+)